MIITEISDALLLLEAADVRLNRNMCALKSHPDYYENEAIRERLADITHERVRIAHCRVAIKNAYEKLLHIE